MHVAARGAEGPERGRIGLPMASCHRRRPAGQVLGDPELGVEEGSLGRIGEDVVGVDDKLEGSVRTGESVAVRVEEEGEAAVLAFE